MKNYKNSQTIILSALVGASVTAGAYILYLKWKHRNGQSIAKKKAFRGSIASPQLLCEEETFKAINNNASNNKLRDDADTAAFEALEKNIEFLVVDNVHHSVTNNHSIINQLISDVNPASDITQPRDVSPGQFHIDYLQDDNFSSSNPGTNKELRINTPMKLGNFKPINSPLADNHLNEFGSSCSIVDPVCRDNVMSAMPGSLNTFPRVSKRKSSKKFYTFSYPDGNLNSDSFSSNGICFNHAKSPSENGSFDVQSEHKYNGSSFQRKPHHMDRDDFKSKYAAPSRHLFPQTLGSGESRNTNNKIVDSVKANNFAQILVAAINDHLEAQSAQGPIEDSMSESSNGAQAFFSNFTILDDLTFPFHSIFKDHDLGSDAQKLENLKRVAEPRVELLIRTLTTISNLSAFSENQIMFRQVGCLNHLMRILSTSSNCRILTACAQCISNLSINEENQKLLTECVPFLLKLLLYDFLAINPATISSVSTPKNPNGTPKHRHYNDNNYKCITLSPKHLSHLDKGAGLNQESPRAIKSVIKLNSRFAVVALNALINLTVLRPCTESFCTNISDFQHNKVEDNDNLSILSKIMINLVTDQQNYEIKLNALRLLVNLSCYPENLPYICRIKVAKNVLFLFDSSIDCQLLLRSVTLLDHVIKYIIEVNRITTENSGTTDSPYGDIEHVIENQSAAETAHSASTYFASASFQTNNFNKSITLLHFEPHSFAGIILDSANYLRGKMFQLKCHRNKNINEIATRIYGYLNTPNV